jgi:hypothetical protein
MVDTTSVGRAGTKVIVILLRSAMEEIFPCRLKIKPKILITF